MTNKARCPIEKSHCQLAVTHLINDAQRRTGLTQQEIDDRLHQANHATVGDGCGTRLSRYITGSRTPKIKDLDRLVRTFLKADLIDKDMADSSFASAIALAPVEHLVQGELDGQALSQIEEDRRRFLSWSEQRVAMKRAELRALNTRVAALNKAATQLIEHLDSINGQGHDGWECTPTLPPNMSINFFNSAGGIHGFERDSIRWLLQAATDTAQTIQFQVSYWHGAHMSPLRAGWYNPRPPAAPAELIQQDLSELDWGSDICG